jgi:hypothetical protein
MAKLPKMFKTKSIAKLDWKKEPISDALERTNFEALGMEAEEIMPDEPEWAWVHEGDVRVEGALEITGTLDGDDVACFIIDGNLVVDGPLLFSQDDFHSALYVTGNLECKNAALEHECELIVGKKLVVEQLLYTFLSDAGHLIAGGLQAKYWLNEWFRGAIYFRSEPAATLLRGGDHKFLLDSSEEEQDDESDGESWSFEAKKAKLVFDVLDKSLLEPEEGADNDKLRKAMAKGKPLFAK